MTRKPAPVEHPIHDLLRERWSPRAFTADPVTPEQIRSLFEAARWSASGGNVQPWSFIVAPRDDEATFGRIFNTLVEGNQAWAGHAPLLVLTVAHLLREPGKPNAYAMYDLGQAVAHLSIQATALGLHVHQMAGFSPEAAREAFAIPEAFAPATVLAIGAAGNPEALSERFRERELAPRTRKPLHSFIFGATWGAPSPLFPLPIAESDQA